MRCSCVEVVGVSVFRQRSALCRDAAHGASSVQQASVLVVKPEPPKYMYPVPFQS